MKVTDSDMRRERMPRTSYCYCDPTAIISGVDRLKISGGYHIGPYVSIEMRHYDARDKERTWIYLGHNVSIQQGTIISALGGHVSIGSRCYIGPNCVLYGQGGLNIGSAVLIGPMVLIVAGNHSIALDKPFVDQGGSALGIVIEDNVWIGGHATILDGVRVGAGSVVAAGAVVTKDVAPGTLVAGVPARAIRVLA